MIYVKGFLLNCYFMLISNIFFFIIETLRTVCNENVNIHTYYF